MIQEVISHYRILSQLGAGGMGEVYLAQDTQLDRQVALKILPAEVAASRDRMERFIREAKAAAALNHPNIATVHEIGEHEGLHFIAMEFINGVTLREQIHREHVELRKLLRFLQHAAEGLAKAHAAGIVHRDLKPDNIMITRDGHAKILDFGLAKLIEPQKLTSSSSQLATAILPQESQPGTVLGTVGYMSPEQAQGKTKEIDYRSDIFSFGCILYEAVTGRRPFEGKDSIDSLNKIIREPAAPISTFNPGAPADLQRIVRRCLAKDPEERYQTIKDVAIELKEVRRELQSAAKTEITPSQAGSDLIRLYSIPVFGGDEKKLVESVESSISFSPDGKRFAFARRHPIKDENYIVLAGADGTNEQILATLKGAERFGGSGPAWSPDGKVIATGITTTDKGSHEYLATVNLADGTIKPIGSQQWDAVGRAGWLADGAGLVVALYEKGAKNAQYYLISYPDGTARRITNDLNDYHDLSLTADTSTLATVQEDRAMNIWVAPGADAKSLRQLTFGSGKYEGTAGVCWTPDGRIVYGAWAGTVGDVWIMNADGSGQRRLTTTPSPLTSWNPAVSPDGRYIAFVSDRAGKSHLWRMDIDGSNLKQLTSGDKFERDACFSPDGKWVFYSDYDGEHLELFKIPFEGGEPVRLTEGFLSDSPQVSPDGKTIAAYYRERGGAPLKIILLPTEGGKPDKILDSSETPCNFKWTPDSRALIYCDTQKGVTNLWSLPVDGGKPRQVTDFNSSQVPWFDLDRSGKPTLFSGAEIRKDVVLITGFR